MEEGLEEGAEVMALTAENVIIYIGMDLAHDKDTTAYLYYGQAKTHKKNRINKKWLKMYGYKYQAYTGPECIKKIQTLAHPPRAE